MATTLNLDNQSDGQQGGNHYADMPFDPISLSEKLNMTPTEFSILKYLMRHRVKSGVEDVKKLIHFAEMLLRFEYGVTADIRYSDEPQNEHQPIYLTDMRADVRPDHKALDCCGVAEEGTEPVEVHSKPTAQKEHPIIESLREFAEFLQGKPESPNIPSVTTIQVDNPNDEAEILASIQQEVQKRFGENAKHTKIIKQADGVYACLLELSKKSERSENPVIDYRLSLDDEKSRYMIVEVLEDESIGEMLWGIVFDDTNINEKLEAHDEGRIRLRKFKQKLTLKNSQDLTR